MMTTNERIHNIRQYFKMSQAELAFKTGFSIKEIICFETKGTVISGYILLKILSAFEMNMDEFKDFNKVCQDVDAGVN